MKVLFEDSIVVEGEGSRSSYTHSNGAVPID